MKRDESSILPAEGPALRDLPSDRKFGLVFAALFLALAAYAYWKALSSAGTALIVLAAAFAAAAWAAPRLLAPLNVLWFRFGIFLGKIVSPIVLSVMFFAVITPVAIVARLFGRDELGLRKREVASYWIERDEKDTTPESFKNQF